MEIQAYFEEWSRRPGELVRMAVSTRHAEVRASLVRLISGPGQGENGIGRVVDFSAVLDKSFAGRTQPTTIGSYAHLPLPGPLPAGAIGIHCWAWPTAPQRETTQAVWSLGDLALVIDSGSLHLQSGLTRLATLKNALAGRHWYSIFVAVGDGKVTLDMHRLDGKVEARRTIEIAAPVALSATRLLLAATGVAPDGSPEQAFNGKIDSPTIHAGPLPAEVLAALHAGRGANTPAWASWRLDQDFASTMITPVTAATAPGQIINGAERGVTGRNWDGRSDSFRDAPGQYAALQFHDDDMVDAEWSYDLDFTLPESLPSGIYAVRLEAGESSNYFPLFVKGSASSQAAVLFLAPTNTYLAYGNDHLASIDFSSVMPHDKVVPDDEAYLFEHAAPGRSCYDTHSDGTPVRYSSRRRPLFNVRPGFPNWLTGSYRHFPVDTYILEWLEHVGIAYDIATDEDLDCEGAALIARYKVIVTGSHPEYWSRTGLDLVEDFLGAGGRIMYLGGNGFYWVTSRWTDKPWVIEVRRDNTGTRCWDAPYGERTHVTTSEAGGLWRTRGRAPNKMLGVGFASEGWSKGCGYRRLEASYKSAAAKFFDGVTHDVIGDYGYVLDGAVGDEVDRFDIALGSPEHAYVLATSTGLGNEYQLVIEDLTLSLPDQGGAQRPDKVRADMVLFPIDGGGCVFSVGSITYGGALAWNDCDNELSRLTGNILRAFVSPDPVL